ncbi:hypothetical protein CHELA1G11_12539 [Hyphomicrobiales bacterium]|nr:hypothetical protein CHELA1G11_12539 [Hyphomicrobiales bacterium]
MNYYRFFSIEVRSDGVFLGLSIAVCFRATVDMRP